MSPRIRTMVIHPLERDGKQRIRSHCGVSVHLTILGQSLSLPPTTRYMLMVDSVTAVPLGIIVVENNADLEQVRYQINKLQVVVSASLAFCFIFHLMREPQELLQETWWRHFD